MDIRYATLSLTPCTSRNCRFSAPGTTAAFQVSPPSVVTTYVPPVPAAQTTREFTGLTEISNCVVPLCCRVSFGCLISPTPCPKAPEARIAEAVSRKTLSESLNIGFTLMRKSGSCGNGRVGVFLSPCARGKVLPNGEKNGICGRLYSGRRPGRRIAGTDCASWLKKFNTIFLESCGSAKT